MGLSEWISLITMAVLAVTAGAIFWYSWETRGVKKEMIRQKALSIRPQIIIYLDEKSQNLYIKNVGKGTAMNVSSLGYLPIMDEKEQKVFLWPDTIDYIVPGQQRRLSFHINNENNKKIEEMSYMNMGYLIEQYANNNYHMHIKFDDIEGNTYCSNIRFGKEGIMILETIRFGKLLLPELSWEDETK